MRNIKKRVLAQRSDGEARTDRTPLFPERMLTPRTELRRIMLDDAQGWKSFNNAIHKRMPVWPYVPSIVYARNELLHQVDAWKSHCEYTYIIIERSTNTIIGDFHIKSIDWKNKTAEFGHALHPRVWGTGITYETLDVVHRAATRRGYSLWCRIEVENVRSIKSIEKYGAVFVKHETMRMHGKSVSVVRYMLPSTLPGPFARRVYVLLKQVPAGKVTTYRDLAHALGTGSYRAIGQVLKRNPYAPQVPCHRVVASDGKIGGFMGETAGGPIEKKIFILKKEGVIIKNGEVIDFENIKHRFA